MLQGGRTLNISIDPVLRIATWIVSLLAAFLSGSSMLSDWPTFALFLYAPRTATVTDPIFARPLSFFLFTLPALQTVVDWLLTLSIIIGIAAIMITGDRRQRPRHE